MENSAETVDTDAEAHSGHTPSRRSHESHVRVRLPVGVAVEGLETGALAKDLDLAGAFVETIDEPECGTPVEIILRYPIVDRALHLPAIVCVVTAAGFRVQFNQLGAREVRAIEALVRAFS